MEKVTVAKTEQLILFLHNYLESVPIPHAESIVYEASGHGIFIMTEDGYCITKPCYSVLSQGIKRGDFQAGRSPLFPSVEIPQHHKDVIDCLWILLDLLPASIDFTVGQPPWIISFTFPGNETTPSKMAQIARFDAGEEILVKARIEAQPRLEEPQYRSKIVRFAMLDEEEKTELVPYDGFVYLCKLDENSPYGYQIIEKREGGDLWRISTY